MTGEMERIGTGRVIGLSGAALDALMPMHIWVGAGNFVVRAGPTLNRLAGRPLHMRRLEEVLSLRRSRRTHALAQLLRMQGLTLRVTLTDLPDLPLKGHVVALPAGTGAFLNLSLGISLVEAVNRFDLKLTDFAPSDLAVELLYLMEGKAAITGELERMAHHLDGARESAEAEAVTDMLTGLSNRRGLDLALDRVSAAHQPVALMHLDLDYFKKVNDTYGHAAGDIVLAEVARVLRAQFRAEDVIARVGGDEFVIVLRDVVDPGVLLPLAERLIARLEEPVQLGDVACRISASIGVSVNACGEGPAPAVLMQQADMALYESKGRGRGCASFYDLPLADACRISVR